MNKNRHNISVSAICQILILMCLFLVSVEGIASTEQRVCYSWIPKDQVSKLQKADNLDDLGRGNVYCRFNAAGIDGIDDVEFSTSIFVILILKPEISIYQGSLRTYSDDFDGKIVSRNQSDRKVDALVLSITDGLVAIKNQNIIQRILFKGKEFYNNFSQVVGSNNPRLNAAIKLSEISRIEQRDFGGATVSDKNEPKSQQAFISQRELKAKTEAVTESVKAPKKFMVYYSTLLGKPSQCRASPRAIVEVIGDSINTSQGRATFVTITNPYALPSDNLDCKAGDQGYILDDAIHLLK